MVLVSGGVGFGWLGSGGWFRVGLELVLGIVYCWFRVGLFRFVWGILLV